MFQAPSTPLSLCVRVGAGLQIAAAALLTLFTAAVVSEGLRWTSEDCWRLVLLAWWLFGVMMAPRRAQAVLCLAKQRQPGPEGPMSLLTICQRSARNPALFPFIPAQWEGSQPYLSPALQALLLAAALVMYLLLSVVAGYCSVWLWGLVNHSYEGWCDVSKGRALWDCGLPHA